VGPWLHCTHIRKDTSDTDDDDVDDDDDDDDYEEQEDESIKLNVRPFLQLQTVMHERDLVNSSVFGSRRNDGGR